MSTGCRGGELGQAGPSGVREERGKGGGPTCATGRKEGDRGKKRKKMENGKRKREKKGKGERGKEREGGICVDAMRPRPATRDGRVRSIAGGIRGVVYGWSATRTSRGEEDGTTGARDREMISGFGV